MREAVATASLPALRRPRHRALPGASPGHVARRRRPPVSSPQWPPVRRRRLSRRPVPRSPDRPAPFRAKPSAAFLRLSPATASAKPVSPRIAQASRTAPVAPPAPS
ncbi:MAG: hypothetical protein E5Y31_19120 [Mesorhizobium sp.]|nr:MAG: hypothetical protein E5Y31_19120 [Mesorhizobium sp.]